jgi:hypothetical protein
MEFRPFWGQRPPRCWSFKITDFLRGKGFNRTPIAPPEGQDIYLCPARVVPPSAEAATGVSAICYTELRAKWSRCVSGDDHAAPNWSLYVITGAQISCSTALSGKARKWPFGSILWRTKTGNVHAYNVTSRSVRATSVAVKSLTYSECVFVALVIQLAERMRHVFICSLSRCSKNFHNISRTAGFSKKKSYWIQNLCFLFPLQLSPETFLIVRRNERDMIKKVCSSSRKVPVILVRF